jgi:hypothetical protein
VSAFSLQVNVDGQGRSVFGWSDNAIRTRTLTPGGTLTAIQQIGKGGGPSMAGGQGGTTVFGWFVVVKPATPGNNFQSTIKAVARTRATNGALTPLAALSKPFVNRFVNHYATLAVGISGNGRAGVLFDMPGAEHGAVGP